MPRLPRANLLAVATLTALITGTLATQVTASASGQTGLVGAGGRAVAHHPGGQAINDPVITAQAPYARFYRTGFKGFEPTMGVDKTGNVFADASVPTSVGGLNAGLGETVIKSIDSGGTWNETPPSLPLTPVSTHDETTDPYFYLDPATDRLFLSDLKPPCQAISYSDNGGTSWTSTVSACDLGDHQTLFAGPPVTSHPAGYQNVVYDCAIGLGLSLAAAATSCDKSLDGGITFTPTGAPAFPSGINTDPGDAGVPGNCEGSTGHGYVGPDGTVYLGRGWCGQPWIAISHDEGMSWTRVKVATNGMAIGPDGLRSHEAGVVADTLGNAYYTWVAHDRLPYLAVSRNKGSTWGPPLMIGPPGLKESDLPGIDIGSPGKIVLVYIGSTNSPGAPFPGGEGPPGNPCVPLVTCAQPTAAYANVTWNGYLTMTVDALDPNPVLYSGSVNDPVNPLIKGICGPDPERCSEGDFVDNAVGPDGTPWGVFVDACSTAAAKQQGSCTNIGEAVVGRLVGGPSLVDATSPLPEAPLGAALLIPGAIVGTAVALHARKRKRSG